MKSGRAILPVVFILISVVACSPTVPQPTPSPTIAATRAAVEPTPAPQSQTAPAATSIPLMTDNWDDRAIFRAGLIKDEQQTLDQLPGASVYRLDVQVADDFSTLHGQVRVRYTNQENVPLDAIYFQLFPNQAGGKSTVSAVTVEGQAITPIYESENATVRVPLNALLPPDQRVVIQLDFNVEVPTNVGGNYGLFGYFNDILVLDGFYPAIPVYDKQGWHAGPVPPNADTTFQDASFYVVRVTAPADVIMIASGLQVDRTQADDQQTVTFAAGPARDFYLAASDRWAVISETIGETTVNSYAFTDRAAGSQAALRTASNAIESYSARLGAYPYTEFDVVSTPMQGAVGIEYPGITGINLAVYDLEATINGVPAPVMLESTVAHEVGHQWFYNAVGNDQHTEPWLDEAVDQYVTGRYFLDQYGRSGQQSYRDSWVGRWERVNQEPIPIGLPAGSYQGKEYGAIVYGRGPLFLEVLAQKMGQVKFDQFLRDYYQSHVWGIGTAADFKQLADQHCQCDLTPLFDEWVTAPAGTFTPTPVADLGESAEAIVQRLVAAKLAALQAKDIDRYLALIDATDPEYYTEQRNWFLIYRDAVTADFSIEVKRVEKIDATTLVATLDQHYLYGPEKADRRVTYEARFIQTPSGWKDADLNFRVIETPHFVIKYQRAVETKAKEVSAEAEKAYASVVEKLGLTPHGKTTLKLFADQELLRQNTDIRVAYLFNGWGEDGESIKLYGFREKEVFAGVVAHELTHKITLGISDSLNSWLAEGLAIYFGSMPFREGNVLKMGWYTADELARPISWLEATTLIDLTDEQTIGLFYAVSGMVVEFTVETYGVDKVQALLTELSKYPRYDRGYDYGAMEQENQTRLHQAIETVLGVDMVTLNQQWLTWIKAQRP